MFRKASEKLPVVEGGSLCSPRGSQRQQGVSQSSNQDGLRDTKMGPKCPQAPPAPAPYSVSLKELCVGTDGCAPLREEVPVPAAGAAPQLQTHGQRGAGSWALMSGKAPGSFTS